MDVLIELHDQGPSLPTNTTLFAITVKRNKEEDQIPVIISTFGSWLNVLASQHVKVEDLRKNRPNNTQEYQHYVDHFLASLDSLTKA
jgi:hypothetical protein